MVKGEGLKKKCIQGLELYLWLHFEEILSLRSSRVQIPFPAPKCDNV